VKHGSIAQFRAVLASEHAEGKETLIHLFSTVRNDKQKQNKTKNPKQNKTKTNKKSPSRKEMKKYHTIGATTYFGFFKTFS
jgi:hypothetical protein